MMNLILVTFYIFFIFVLMYTGVTFIASVLINIVIGNCDDVIVAWIAGMILFSAMMTVTVIKTAI